MARRRVKPPDPAAVAAMYRAACAARIQKPIWKAVLKQVVARKRQSECVDEGACEESRRGAAYTRATPVEQLACEAYVYWEDRAWTSSTAWGGDFPRDPAARADWIAAGGKRPRAPFGFMRLNRAKK